MRYIYTVISIQNICFIINSFFLFLFYFLFLFSLLLLLLVLLLGEVLNSFDFEGPLHLDVLPPPPGLLPDFFLLFNFPPHLGQGLLLAFFHLPIEYLLDLLLLLLFPLQFL